MSDEWVNDIVDDQIAFLQSMADFIKENAENISIAAIVDTLEDRIFLLREAYDA